MNDSKCIIRHLQSITDDMWFSEQILGFGFISTEVDVLCVYTINEVWMKDVSTGMVVCSTLPFVTAAAFYKGSMYYYSRNHNCMFYTRGIGSSVTHHSFCQLDGIQEITDVAIDDCKLYALCCDHIKVYDISSVDVLSDPVFLKKITVRKHCHHYGRMKVVNGYIHVGAEDINGELFRISEHYSRRSKSRFHSKSSQFQCNENLITALVGGSHSNFFDTLVAYMGCTDPFTCMTGDFFNHSVAFYRGYAYIYCSGSILVCLFHPISNKPDIVGILASGREIGDYSGTAQLQIRGETVYQTSLYDVWTSKVVSWTPFLHSLYPLWFRDNALFLYLHLAENNYPLELLFEILRKA